VDEQLKRDIDQCRTAFNFAINFIQDNADIRIKFDLLKKFIGTKKLGDEFAQWAVDEWWNPFLSEEDIKEVFELEEPL
jgi:hypothetical protein